MATIFIQGNFRFEIIDEKEKTVKIMKKDQYTEYNGKLMIPSSVEHEGETYSIVEIGGIIRWTTTEYKRVEDKRRKGGYREEPYEEVHSTVGFRETKISEIVIPSSCERIGYSAFMGCTKLKEISIHGTVSRIDTDAFADCSNIEKIIIHDGVKTIGYNAFRGCKIKNIFIPASVDTIGSNAFYNCKELKEVIIDDSDGIISIDESAFEHCPKCKIKYKSQMGFFGKLFH
jgi:hypothetical protein